MSDTPKKYRVVKWEKFQTYRKDRGQPPWIKIYRTLLRHVEWITLSDQQRGHLVSIWLLAADHYGEIPGDPAIVRKLCQLDSDPDLKALVSAGFITGCQDDAKWLPSGCQDGSADTEAETDTETDTKAETEIDTKTDTEADT